VPVTLETKLDRLVEKLKEEERGLALVFVRTKHGADKLARKLSRQHSVKTVVMHGNIVPERTRALARRLRVGRVSTLVATDVAARGLDVDDITHVITLIRRTATTTTCTASAAPGARAVAVRASRS